MAKKTLLAALVLFTAIVGTGIFALPYSVFHLPSGMGWLVLVGVISALLNWLYVLVVIATPENLQLAGFAQKYFPKGGKWLGALAVLVNLNGVLLAYLVSAGSFLAGLMPFWSSFTWGLVFYAVILLVTVLGIKRIVELNRILAVLLIILVGVFVVWGSSLFNPENFRANKTGGFIRLIPVILFSYAGFAVIPEMEELFPRNENQLKKAVIVGSVLPIILYFIFCLVVIGVLGERVTTDFVSGVKGFSRAVFIIGNLIGIVAVSSSGTAFGFSLKEFWHRDMGLDQPKAYSLAFLPSLALYLIGIRDLLPILSWTGGLSTLLITVVIVGCYWRLRVK